MQLNLLDADIDVVGNLEGDVHTAVGICGYCCAVATRCTFRSHLEHIGTRRPIEVVEAVTYLIHLADVVTIHIT